jgi:hypothetical protein
MAEWNYSIRPYRRSADGDGWTPAEATDATAWFGFRERGDDRRCFGVFPSRQDAEQAMALLKREEIKPQINRGIKR